MCNFYSPIITRDFKVLDCVNIDDSHETVIKEHKLKDNKLKNRDFVRLEITPIDWNKLSKRFNKSLWRYKVDEKNTLPKWYIKHQRKIKRLVFDELREIYRDKFIFKGEKEVKKGRCWVFKKGKVILYNHSSAELYGYSSAKLYDHSSAKLYNSSSAKLYDSSSAVLHNSSSAKLYHHSSALLYNSSSVELYNSSSAELYYHSSVKLYDYSSAVLYYHSSAKLYNYSSAVGWGYKNVEVKDKAMVIDKRDINKVKTITAGN